MSSGVQPCALAALALGLVALGVMLCGLALLRPSVARATIWGGSERVRALLASEDPKHRLVGAQRLGECPLSVVEGVLPVLLQDPDLEVRLRAAELARRVPSTPAWAVLGDAVVGWLAEPAPRVRQAAAELLGVHPAPRAVTALGRALADTEVPVRLAAARALGAAASADAVTPLLSGLDDGAAEVREAVVEALARLGDDRAVLPLIGRVQDQQGSVRAAVARALGKLGDHRASSALVLALRDDDEAVRLAVLDALSLLAASEAVVAVGSLMRSDARSVVREAAARTLAAIGSASALDALVAALEGEDPLGPSVHRAALVSIGQPVVARLARCLQEATASSTLEGCAVAAGEVQAESLQPELQRAMLTASLRPLVALRALEQLRSSAALPLVLEQLVAQDPFVRRAAMDAAAAILDPQQPDGRAVEPLTAALEAAPAGTPERIALVTLLGRTGAPRAAAVLAAYVDERTTRALRLAAIDALGDLGPSSADAVLLRALDDESSDVRLAAALALGRSGSGRSALRLLERLERSSRQDRANLVMALGGPASRSSDPELVRRLARLVRMRQGGERDGLLEALGRVPGAAALGELERLSRALPEPAARRKLAEVLVARREALQLVRRLLGDRDGAVRASAVWALGEHGVAADLDRVASAVADRELAVAANAAAALGRLARRVPAAREPLCKAVSDPRAQVRASALGGARVAGLRCPGDPATALLRADPSPAVRAAAAALVRSVPGPDAAAERVMLARCAREEPSGQVASQCVAPAARAPRAASATDPVTVFVVPVGSAAPVGTQPYLLERPDGLVRLGVTDRRGAVFEPLMPRGKLRLGVPASAED